MLFHGPRLLLCGPYYTVTIVLYDIGTRNRNHAFTLYSEVQKANKRIEENSYKCTSQMYAVHCEENEKNKFVLKIEIL